MRLDVFLFNKGFYDSRTKSLQAIERGEVLVEGKKIIKPSFDISESIDLIKISCVKEKSFVSLGGYKLDKALSDFNFKVNDFIALDLGASTGGFTDCLIQNGAKKVYAVDLNDGLLHENLKKDDRVVSIIKNARNLKKSDINNEIDFICADLSFISETVILPVISELLYENCFAVVLIKPQFETGERRKVKNGIIKDQTTRKEVCQKIFSCAVQNGLTPVKFTTAPIQEKKNVEYLVLLRKGNFTPFDLSNYSFK